MVVSGFTTNTDSAGWVYMAIKNTEVKTNDSGKKQLTKHAEAFAIAERDMGKIDSEEDLRNIDKSLFQYVESYYCDIVENKCLYHSADGSDTDSAKELGHLIDGIINNNNIDAVEKYQDVVEKY